MLSASGQNIDNLLMITQSPSPEVSSGAAQPHDIAVRGDSSDFARTFESMMNHRGNPTRKEPSQEAGREKSASGKGDFEKAAKPKKDVSPKKASIRNGKRVAAGPESNMKAERRARVLKSTLSTTAGTAGNVKKISKSETVGVAKLEQGHNTGKITDSVSVEEGISRDAGPESAANDGHDERANGTARGVVGYREPREKGDSRKSDARRDDGRVAIGEREALPPAGRQDPGPAVAIDEKTDRAGERSGDLPDMEREQRISGKKVIEVRDYRTNGSRESSAQSRAPADAAEPGRSEQDADIRLVRISHPTVTQEGGEVGKSPFARSPFERSPIAQSPFARYVSENLSSEMVKQTGIILRNNDRGEIRLVLKPEHLGRVRMRIQLDANRLTGRIMVESGFVKETLEQNLESLYRAFRDSGYETGGFEVLVDSRGEGKTAADQRRGQLDSKTVKQLDDAVPILEEIDHQSDVIDLVV